MHKLKCGADCSILWTLISTCRELWMPGRSTNGCTYTHGHMTRPFRKTHAACALWLNFNYKCGCRQFNLTHFKEKSAPAGSARESIHCAPVPLRKTQSVSEYNDV